MTSPSRDLGPTISGLGGFTANGLTPQTGFPLVSEFTSFSTVVAGAYAVLPGANQNELTIYNYDASNSLNLIPEPGDKFVDKAANVALSIAPNTAVKVASFDTPLTPKPRRWHVQAPGSGGGTSLSVTDNTTTVASVGTIVFTSGATVTSGGAGIADVAISGGGGGGVTSVITQGGPFLNDGTITTTGTVSNSSASLTAHGVVLAQGTSAVVATAALTNGQLLIGATGADPAPQTMSGDAAISATGSVTVSKVAGNTLSANQGAVMNNGTVSVNNAITLAGTAAGTLTPTPTTGTTDVIINMPAAGGTVTVNGGPTFARQRMLEEIHQGATAGVLNHGTVFKFTGAVTTFTLTPTANAIDRLEWMSPDGTSWVNLAINQNATL